MDDWERPVSLGSAKERWVVARWALPVRRLWDLAEAAQECFYPDVVCGCGERDSKMLSMFQAGFRRHPLSWKPQEIVFRRV